MEYEVQEDGNFQVTLTLPYKVGDSVYEVQPDRSIKVVEIQGVKISSFKTKAGYPDSLSIIYYCTQVGVQANNGPKEVYPNKLFRRIEDALAAATRG